MIYALLLAVFGAGYGLQLSPGSFPKPLTAEQERRYLEMWAAGDVEARNILVEHNLRLVSHIMKKYYTQTADQEDLISIGTIGLIKAIETFDYTKGTRLATYAARCVENEILMYFRSTKKTSRDVSLSEEIEQCGDGNTLSLMDVVGQEDELFQKIGTEQQIALLKTLIETELTPQQRQVVVMRYGLNGMTPMKQRTVAKHLKISRSYVSRIEKRALEILKCKLQ